MSRFCLAKRDVRKFQKLCVELTEHVVVARMTAPAFADWDRDQISNQLDVIETQVAGLRAIVGPADQFETKNTKPEPLLLRP